MNDQTYRCSINAIFSCSSFFTFWTWFTLRASFSLRANRTLKKISHEDNLSRQANRNPAFRFKDEDDYEYEIRVEVFSRLLKI